MLPILLRLEKLDWKEPPPLECTLDIYIEQWRKRSKKKKKGLKAAIEEYYYHSTTLATSLKALPLVKIPCQRFPVQST